MGGIEPYRHEIAQWYMTLSKLQKTHPYPHPTVDFAPLVKLPPPYPLHSLRSRKPTLPSLPAGFRNVYLYIYIYMYYIYSIYVCVKNLYGCLYNRIKWYQWYLWLFFTHCPQKNRWVQDRLAGFWWILASLFGIGLFAKKSRSFCVLGFGVLEDW